MSARILVVENVATDAQLLEALFLHQYYEVLTANHGADAIEICRSGQVDIIVLEVQLPDMDGFEVCRRLKDDAATSNIPVIMLTSFQSPEDRIRGLEAGADDYFIKPVKDQALLSRVKSLSHFKTVSDELFSQAGIGADLEVERLAEAKLSARLGGGESAARILVVDEDHGAAASLRTVLCDDFFVDSCHAPIEAVLKAIEGDYDTIIISASSNHANILKFCAQLRAIEKTRHIPVILVVDEDEGALVVSALELGVNDYLMRPLEKLELYSRLRTQIKRKCYNELLRQSLHRAATGSVTDSLTGLHNRRYLDRHMSVFLARAENRNRPLSVVMIDFDHFKTINDQFGHDAGDEVLREFATRLRKIVRNMDVICRYGGEEFVIVLPDASAEIGALVAERVRKMVAEKPFSIGKEQGMAQLTISVGISELRVKDDDCEALFARAEAAMLKAKSRGRNRIVLSAA